MRGTAERKLDNRVDGKERNLSVVGRTPNLVIGDDAFGGQNDFISRHRQVDIHKLQAVDLRVAVGVAALHVDQRHVRIERWNEQQLLVRKWAVHFLGFGPLLQDIGTEH